MKQNFYQLEGTKIREFITILHIPYTLMCLSFLTIGFGVSGIINWSAYWLTMLAYFFGLGIAAHSFDQLKGMGSSYVKLLNENDLIIIGVSSLLVSILFGIHLIVALGARYLLILIPLQVFFVFAYPMKILFKGFFHDDFWFAVSFGFLPVVIGYFVNTLTFSPIAIVWGVVALTISGIEINLSRYVRKMRKVKGEQYANDRVVYNNYIYPEYIKRPERALKLLCLMTYLLAIILAFFN